MEKQHDTILFDMDGTLFDTERLYHAGWNYAGVPDDVYRQMIGRNPEEIRELLLRYPELGNPDEIRAEKEKYTNSLLEKEIPMKPYLLETLQWLKANGYRCCIATSSAVETAERYLKKTNTAAYIEKIISGRNLAHSKPSPDIYLLAAKEMGVSPSKCVVVEDSFNGVRSGHAAGMKTVMIPDAVPPDAEMKKTADAILPSLKELPACIEALQLEEAAEDVSRTTDSYSCTIRAASDSYAFFSIPNDSGWKASVNGEEQEILDICGFMAVPVSAGENRIVFTYTVPGLAAGILGTLAGALITAVYLVLSRKMKKREAQALPADEGLTGSEADSPARARR